MKKITTLLLLFTFLLPHISLAETEAERRERLEDQLQKVEQQIIQQAILVEGKQKERQSLERDLNIIDAEIRQTQLGIEARTLAISQLSGQIGDKAEVLDILTERLAKQRSSLAELIRQTHSVDDFTLAEVLLSNQNFSDFFTDADRFVTVKNSLNQSLSALEEIKTDTQDQKLTLEEKQQVEAEMKLVQEQQRETIEVKEAEKESILAVTRGEEEIYQEILQQNQKTASQLRAQLFDLLGGGGPIPFPEAVAFAQVAQGLTGVSAALILAILEQESAYGSNIGGCTMADTSVGRDIMHPERDRPVFLAIARTLGFDPQLQPVSCPLIRSDGTRIGWGGAMGPSQFIPSTWAIFGGFVSDGAGGHTYVASRDAIRSILGRSGPSSPFVNQDAFLATALLLRDNGATGGYAEDRRAALRYYAGWGGASNPENAFYGDGVMNRKARLQNEINILGV